MSEDNERLDHLLQIHDPHKDALAAQFASARLYAAQAEDSPGEVNVSAATVVMRMIGTIREELDHVEVRMTEAMLDAGLSWDDVSSVTGRTSRQAAQQRYRRLGGARTWPTRRPDAYAPVDHPGVDVPADLQDWSTSWPDYSPVDITPPELRPSALLRECPEWAEPSITPDDIDWNHRTSEAVIPFAFDERGWPLNPQGRTGRTGRNLGKWGENAAADPIVVAGTCAQRKVLLITRGDIGVDAIPGGMVDPGETAPAALVRELQEETGVDLTDQQPVILGSNVVDDWRNTDHAWVVSTSALYQLEHQITATAGDDATDANWWTFSSLNQLDQELSAAGRTLYEAHRPLLQRALDQLNEA